MSSFKLTEAEVLSPFPHGAESSSSQLAHDLLFEHQSLQAKFKAHLKSQGVIEELWDTTKISLGASSKDKHWYDPRFLWSKLCIDYDRSSQATQFGLDQELDKLKKLEHAASINDNRSFSQLKKELCDNSEAPKPNTQPTLHSYRSVNAYLESQANGVEGISDIAAVGAAIVTDGLAREVVQSLKASMLVCGITSGAIKSLLKGVDGRYSQPKLDFVTGVVTGMLLPSSELIGCKASKAVVNRFGQKLDLRLTGEFLDTQIANKGRGLGIKLLSSASKSGVAGASFFGTEDVFRESVLSLRRGETPDFKHIAERAALSAGLAFVGSSALGLVFRGPEEMLGKDARVVEKASREEKTKIDSQPAEADLSTSEPVSIGTTNPAATNLLDKELKDEDDEVVTYLVDQPHTSPITNSWNWIHSQSQKLLEDNEVILKPGDKRLVSKTQDDVWSEFKDYLRSRGHVVNEDAPASAGLSLTIPATYFFLRTDPVLKGVELLTHTSPKATVEGVKEVALGIPHESENDPKQLADADGSAEQALPSSNENKDTSQPDRIQLSSIFN